MDRRRESRLLVEVRGFYERPNARPYDIVFDAISAHGCRLNRVEPDLAVGEAIALNLGPIGPFEATIRWRRDNCVGVEFREALDPAIVAYFAAFCGTAA